MLLHESPYAGMIARRFTLSEFQRELQCRMSAWTHTLATTTPLGVGMAASASGGGTQTFAANTNSAWLNGATPATTDAVSGRSALAPQFQMLPACAYVIETGSSFADVRWWVGAGINSFGGGLGDDVSPGGDFVGFRASSGVDTGWYFFAADLANTTQTGYNTGIPISVSTRYDFLVIHYSSTQLYGYIATGPDAPMSGPFPLAMPTGIVQTAASNTLCALVENKADSAKAIRSAKIWYSRR
jgi:hypothetical protein